MCSFWDHCCQCLCLSALCMKQQHPLTLPRALHYGRTAYLTVVTLYQQWTPHPHPPQHLPPKHTSKTTRAQRESWGGELCGLCNLCQQWGRCFSSDSLKSGTSLSFYTWRTVYGCCSRGKTLIASMWPKNIGYPAHKRTHTCTHTHIHTVYIL